MNQLQAMKKRIEGHSDAVLCCHVVGSKKLLVSGGEDGNVCFTDLNTVSNVGTVHQPYGDAVTSTCSSRSNDEVSYASAGQTVFAIDLRKGYSDKALIHHWTLNTDEINSIAVNQQGSWLAAGDDAGEVQMIQLQHQHHELQQRQQVGGAPQTATAPSQQTQHAGAREGRPTYKTLRRGHTNICGAVAFRPHRPWELLSGGLDSTVVRWDFSRLRPLHTWSLNAEAASSGGQMFNPPMVHSVVVPDTEDRPYCRLMAVGRGDGYISVYDIDSKPSLPPEIAEADRRSSSAKTGKTRGKSKNKGGGESERWETAQQMYPDGQPSPSLVHGASTGQVGSGSAGCAEEGNSREPGLDFGLHRWRLPFVPGRVALLGREQGGHTAAVSSLTFLEAGACPWGRLVSGANDGRLLVWDWQLAAERQAASWKLPIPNWGTPKDGRGGRGASGAWGATMVQPPDEGLCGAGKGDPELRLGVDTVAMEECPVVIADVKHGRKVNWVCSCGGIGGFNLIVADISRKMTALHIG